MDNSNLEQPQFNVPPEIDLNDEPSIPLAADSDIDDSENIASEEDDESPDLNSSNEEDEEEEEPHRPSKEKSSVDYNKIQRERYRYEHLARQREEEAYKLAGENERLRQLAEEAYQASTFHHANSLELKLKMAKEKKTQAYESGDVSALTDADVEISKINYELQESNKIKAQHDYYLEQQRQQQVNAPSQEQIQNHYREKERANQIETQRWMLENPWANPKTRDYNKDLDFYAEKVALDLNNSLSSSGREDLIYSRPYFDEIDNRISQYINQQQNNTRRPLNMKAPNVPVSSVRSGTHSQSSSRSSDGLTPAEREFAKSLGPDASKYFKKALDHDKRNNSDLRKIGRGQ